MIFFNYFCSFFSFTTKCLAVLLEAGFQTSESLRAGFQNNSSALEEVKKAASKADQNLFDELRNTLSL